MEQESPAWQDLRPRDRMEYLLNTGHLSDCSFVVFSEDGEKITLKCHKFILMCASPVFERMFEGDFEESRTPENIVLDDVSANDFKKFIEYIYWHDNRKVDRCELSTLQNLIYLGKKFMVANLTKLCIATVNSRLHSFDTDTIIDLYEYAHQIDHKPLIDNVAARIQDNPARFITASAMFDLSSEIFLNFISLFNHGTTELARFQAIESYCKILGFIEEDASPKKTSTNDDNRDSNAEETNSNASFDENTDYIEDEIAPPLRKKHCVPEVARNEKLPEKDVNDNEAAKKDEEVVDTDDGVDAVKEKQEVEEQLKKQEEERVKKETHRKEYLKKLLKLIRFEYMTPFDFCRGPGRSTLLDLQLKYDMLSKICISEYNRR